MASTTTAQNIIDDIESIAQDSTNVRWTAAYLLAGINSGQKKICLIKPDAYIKSVALKLAEGTVQALPSDGSQLQLITHNMGTDGSTPGAPINLMTIAAMNAWNPSWHTDTGDAEVKFYMYDERLPLQFFVSPPQPAASQGYVQMFYPATPADIAADATILLADAYRPALLDYGLYWAYMMDADSIPNANRALAHYQAFADALGIKRQVEEIEDPNRQSQTLK